jgi:metallopeptidase MepB
MSLTDEELDGIPKVQLDSYPIGPDGKREVPVDGGGASTFMRYANNADVRKRMQEAHGMKVPQNAALFKQIIRLRDSRARAIGYKSHAAYRLPDRMVESTEWVDSLLDMLTEKLLPHGKAEFEKLEKKKKAHLEAANIHPGEVKIESWDIAYYERLVEEEAAVDHKRIVEFFPLRRTVGAMLEVFASCLQLHFAPIPAEDLRGSTWSDDIEVWSVWDQRPEADGAFVGYLYADLLERPNKFKGNQCVNLQKVGRTPSN